MLLMVRNEIYIFRENITGLHLVECLNMYDIGASAIQTYKRDGLQLISETHDIQSHHAFRHINLIHEVENLYVKMVSWQHLNNHMQKGPNVSLSSCAARQGNESHVMY